MPDQAVTREVSGKAWEGLRSVDMVLLAKLKVEDCLRGNLA